MNVLMLRKLKALSAFVRFSWKSKKGRKKKFFTQTKTTFKNIVLRFVAFCPFVWSVGNQLHTGSTSRCFIVFFNPTCGCCPSPQTLLEFAGRWSLEEEPLPLLEVYIVALLSYVEASPFLSPQCENVQLVVERLSL